jgi:putative endonuclease
MFHTYILYSKSIRQFYTGQTADLQNRLNEHNTGQTKSIAKGIPWALVWSATSNTRSEAMQWERKIKNRGASCWIWASGCSVARLSAWRLGRQGRHARKRGHPDKEAVLWTASFLKSFSIRQPTFVPCSIPTSCTAIPSANFTRGRPPIYRTAWTNTTLARPSPLPGASRGNWSGRRDRLIDYYSHGIK